jgi:hypothetical protein
MSADIVQKDEQYLLNQCTKYLAREATEPRHSNFGISEGQRRASISEAWRFPIIDSHDSREDGAYEWNDVTFVHAAESGRAVPHVQVLGTFHRLDEPLPLQRIGETPFSALTLKLPKGRCFRYVFLIDDSVAIDDINPQEEWLQNGERWSRFFTWAYNQPLVFERWEYTLVDRLTREILPFRTPDAQNFLDRGANDRNVGHLYRLNITVGVPNYIDKVLAREERHQINAYRTCLGLIRTVLQRRFPGKDPEFLDRSVYAALYGDMAANGAGNSLFADGWDRSKYADPYYFIYLLRRHAITGAFSHPKYGGNSGGMAWGYLEERFRTDTGETAFGWRQAIERPLGTSKEYLG